MGKKANERKTTTTQMATMTLTMSMNGQKKRIKNPAHTYANTKSKQPKKEKPTEWVEWAVEGETRAGEPENAVQPAIIISSRCNSLPYKRIHMYVYVYAYVCTRMCVSASRKKNKLKVSWRGETNARLWLVIHFFHTRRKMGGRFGGWRLI